MAKKTFTLMGFIIATLRRASYRWPARSECMKKSRIRRGFYRCAICGNEVQKKNMALDHVMPIVPVTGWDSYDGFIRRLFCEVGGFQTICKDPCHQAKTNIENAERRKNKNTQ